MDKGMVKWKKNGAKYKEKLWNCWNIIWFFVKFNSLLTRNNIYTHIKKTIISVK